jgi:hypothetical protein
VNLRIVLLFSLFTTLLIGSFLQASGVQMTVFLSPQLNSSDVIFTGVRFITIKYDPGSALAKQFSGKTERVSFTMKATEDGMPRVISVINQDIANQKKSPVRIENATIDYRGEIRGDPDKVSLSYKVELRPTLTNYVLQKGQNQPAVLDLDWRGVVISQPLVLDTPKYGKISINYPIGLIQAINPQLANKLLNSPASSIMTDPLFNFQDIGRSMDTWHFLFDPTGSQAGSAGMLTAQGGARAVSVYSLGESSFREGTLTEKVSDITATVDGQQVGIHAATPPPSAQIQISGFSRIQKSGASELAFVSDQAPAGTETATGGFPIQVLLILGGMMGAVAVFVLLKTRK